jgi:hypothetical protein
MKTRSGIVPLPSGWPSVYEARKGVADMQMQSQVMSALKRILTDSLSETDRRKKRLSYLTASEIVLKYHFMLGDDAAQKLINGVIKKSETIPDLKEYAKQFKVLSDHHRVLAKKAYVEFFFKGLMDIDCAKHVASFVTV